MSPVLPFRSTAALGDAMPVSTAVAGDARYRTMLEVAAILKYRGRWAGDSARKFLRAHGAPFYRRGRTLLVDVDDVHEVITTGQCLNGLERRRREVSGTTRRRRFADG